MITSAIRPIRSSLLLATALSVSSLPVCGYRAPDQRTVYDDWIADSQYAQKVAQQEKDWARRSQNSGYNDYSAELAALNEQSRIQARWAAEDAAEKAARQAERDRRRRAREAETKKLLALYDAAEAGNADALMTLAKRSETSEFLLWGLREYQRVRGPRRKEALQRMIALLELHAAGSEHRLVSIRPMENLLAELAHLGDAAAAKKLGLRLLEAGDIDEAGRYLAQAAEAGDAAARDQALLLLAHDRVDTLQIEPSKVFAWCQSADLQNSIAAQYVLGRALLRGADVPRDPDAGLKILIKAATSEVEVRSAEEGKIRASAAELAGIALRDGVGRTPASISAVSLLQAAANSGRASAMRELGKTYFWGSTTPADRASALHWFREGMKRGDGEAAYLLSFALLRPEASADETDEGLVALRRAARRHPEAMIRFGKLLYDGGLGIAADPPEAREYFALALQRYPKNGDVLEFLGSAYANGEYGVKNNPQEGVRLLALAWEHGSTIAAQRLEQIYRAGRGVPANPAAADEWKARSEAPHAPARDTSPETQT